MVGEDVVRPKEALFKRERNLYGVGLTGFEGLVSRSPYGLAVDYAVVVAVKILSVGNSRSDLEHSVAGEVDRAAVDISLLTEDADRYREEKEIFVGSHRGGADFILTYLSVPDSIAVLGKGVALRELYVYADTDVIALGYFIDFLSEHLVFDCGNRSDRRGSRAVELLTVRRDVKIGDFDFLRLAADCHREGEVQLVAFLVRKHTRVDLLTVDGHIAQRRRPITLTVIHPAEEVGFGGFELYLDFSLDTGIVIRDDLVVVGSGSGDLEPRSAELCNITLGFYLEFRERLSGDEGLIVCDLDIAAERFLFLDGGVIYFTMAGVIIF